MQNGHGSAVLDEMLEPVSRSLGLKTARALAALRVGGRTQARVEKLQRNAMKAGSLSTNAPNTKPTSRPARSSEFFRPSRGAFLHKPKPLEFIVGDDVRSL